MENLKIYIATHCDFKCPVNGKHYEIADSRKMKIDNAIFDFFYAEIYQYKWLRDNLELPEYVGFCGYRKYFSFMDNVDENSIIKLINQYGCIVGQRLELKENIRQHYFYNHNITDLENLESVVNLSGFSEFFTEYLFGHTLYPCNMFIMKREDFVEMIDFVWKTISDFIAKYGWTKAQLEDVMNYVSNQNRMGHTLMFGGEKHQSRIGGYLAERLVSGYIAWKFTNAVAVGMKMTGERIR